MEDKQNNLFNITLAPDSLRALRGSLWRAVDIGEDNMGSVTLFEEKLMVHQNLQSIFLYALPLMAEYDKLMLGNDS